MMAAFLGFSGAIANYNALQDLPNWRSPKGRVSRRYPEQSSRQAVRGARRQQGGNGIVLTSEFQYVER